jgi:hypothetical protein
VAGLSLCLVVALVVVWLVADRGEQPPDPPLATSVRQDLATDTLDDLEAAVRERDPAATEKLARPTDDAAREALRAVVANAEDLRVADFSLRYVDEDLEVTSRLDDGYWAAAVDTTWRFDGFDAAPGNAEVTFRFGMDGDRAVFVSAGGGDRVSPLWLAGRLQVRRTPTTLVAVDGSPQALDRYARLAARAVPVVRRVLPDWRDGLVVEVPATAEAVDDALGADPGTYSSIAAVTTTTDGSLAGSAPVHVFVNPKLFGDLRDVGAQVVMSHEATHVATDAPRSSTPLWLLEGFADYVALRDVDLPLSVTAGQITRQVREDGAPRELPTQAEFDTRTEHLGAAYEAAWLACRVLAEIGGERQLVTLYQRTSQGGDLGATLRDVYGFSVAELTRQWRAELEDIAR